MLKVNTKARYYIQDIKFKELKDFSYSLDIILDNAYEVLSVVKMDSDYKKVIAYKTIIRALKQLDKEVSNIIMNYFKNNTLDNDIIGIHWDIDFNVINEDVKNILEEYKEPENQGDYCHYKTCDYINFMHNYCYQNFDRFRIFGKGV